MKIRPAGAADAAAIADLWNGMISGTLHTFTDVEKTPQEVAALINARPAAFWLAEAEALAGFVTFGPFRSGPGYAATVEHSIVLAPSARGQGLGRRLMLAAEKAAQDQGVHVMIAGISSANAGAVAFHNALGFVQAGLLREVGRKRGQWLDLILMQKSLSAS
jgi:phosphinothricin acetyltransferase